MKTRNMQFVAFCVMIFVCHLYSGAVFASEISDTFDKIKRNSAALKAADKAPHTEFLIRSGKKISLSEFEGKVVLLNFWASWCPPCVSEMPELNELQNQYQKDGLEVVTVSQDFRGLEKAISFFDRYRLRHLTVYADNKNALFNAVKGDSLPLTLLIDRKGHIRNRIEGYFNWQSAEAQKTIQSLLKE